MDCLTLSFRHTLSLLWLMIDKVKWRDENIPRREEGVKRWWKRRRRPREQESLGQWLSSFWILSRSLWPLREYGKWRESLLREGKRIHFRDASTMHGKLRYASETLAIYSCRSDRTREHGKGRDRDRCSGFVTSQGVGFIERWELSVSKWLLAIQER